MNLVDNTLEKASFRAAKGETFVLHGDIKKKFLVIKVCRL